MRAWRRRAEKAAKRGTRWHAMARGGAALRDMLYSVDSGAGETSRPFLWGVAMRDLAYAVGYALGVTLAMLAFVAALVVGTYGILGVAASVVA